MDVHARDVVVQLAAEGIEGQPQHFSWLSQLRMYWEQPPGQGADQDKTIVVRMMNAQAEYGFEYLGASSRLVVTPLTDRCVGTWCCAAVGKAQDALQLKCNQHGNAKGPAQST
jgi:dynein heavy chain